MNPPLTLISVGVIAAMLDRASRTPPGAFVEVGVYRGGSAFALYQLAQAQKRTLYLYDTFAGIPWKSEGDWHQVGDFSDCDAHSVRGHCPEAVTIGGIFPSSAVNMGPIAFAHLDCDQYRSYHEAIDHLLPQMVPGGAMWFDDSPCLEGAHRAVVEFFGDRVKTCVGKHYVEV